MEKQKRRKTDKSERIRLQESRTTNQSRTSAFTFFRNSWSNFIGSKRIFYIKLIKPYLEMPTMPCPASQTIVRHRKCDFHNRSENFKDSLLDRGHLGYVPWFLTRLASLSLLIKITNSETYSVGCRIFEKLFHWQNFNLFIWNNQVQFAIAFLCNSH